MKPLTLAQKVIDSLDDVPCPVCGKRLTRNKKVAYSGDDNAAWRFVGADCYSRIRGSGSKGYAKNPGEVKWYATKDMAMNAIKRDKS